MNKDAILASVIGFAIGLCITGFLLVGPNILKNLPQISLPKRIQTTSDQAGATNPDESTLASASGGFVVQSPAAEDIVSEDTLTVSGTAEAGTLVVIQSYSEENVTISTPEGTFSSTLTLEEGRNDIIVTNYVKGKPETTTIAVYYTEEEL